MKKLLFAFLVSITACKPSTPMAVTPPPPTITVAVTSTSVPVTDTPVPTLTIAFSPTPLPRFFTYEFDAAPADWVTLQAGNEAVPTIKSENSQLFLQMDAPYTWVYSIYSAQDYDNIRVEARFSNQGGSPASIGLVCRYSETDGWLEYNISTDGSYHVLYGQWLANGIADYLPVLTASTNAIQPSGTSQEIGLICAGTTLSLFIDQVLIRNVDVSRFELAQGKVGLTASSFENIPVIAAFDWVRVSEP